MGYIHWGAYTWGGLIRLYMEIVSNEKIDGLILGGAYTRGGWGGAYIRRFTVSIHTRIKPLLLSIVD